jgi:hypothetical protein
LKYFPKLLFYVYVKKFLKFGCYRPDPDVKNCVRTLKARFGRRGPDTDFEEEIWTSRNISGRQGPDTDVKGPDSDVKGRIWVSRAESGRPMPEVMDRIQMSMSEFEQEDWIQMPGIGSGSRRPDPYVEDQILMSRTESGCHGQNPDVGDRNRT